MTISSKDYDKPYFDKRDGYSSRANLWKRTWANIKGDKPKRVLDVGCGRGYCVKFLRELGVDAWGVDSSEAAKETSLVPEFHVLAPATSLPFKDGEFDVVISSDFFEHLRDDEIDLAALEMRRVGKKVYARICFKEEPPYHLTVKPLSWWRERLKNVIIMR